MNCRRSIRRNGQGLRRRTLLLLAEVVVGLVLSVEAVTDAVADQVVLDANVSYEEENNSSG